MANNKHNSRASVNLLPTFFRTDKNSKFLSSTIDQLIKAPSLERIDGFVGNKLGLTFNPSDSYIDDNLPLRGKYQLEPALVIRELDNSIKKAFGIDDLINQLSYNGINTTNIDRLFKPKINSYNPHISWDKFVNFREYFWLKNGPDTITISAANELDIETSVLGKVTYTSPTGVTLINGLKIRFIGNIYPASRSNIEYYVEGVGSSIQLIPKVDLETFDKLSTYEIDAFSSNPFDQLPFDSYKKIPVNPEYVTINRSSVDKNTWSRYNRWFHKDVITLSATANGVTTPVYPLDTRAKRPIIEFNANLQLWNFGSTRIAPVDLIDTLTVDVFSTIESVQGYYVDGVLLEDGFRVIFSADTDPIINNKIFEVRIAQVDGVSIINLEEVETIETGATAVVRFGTTYFGSEWWFNGSKWVYAQQKDTLSQFPLFDLYDEFGHSYSDTVYHNTDFIGNAIFGYSIGEGTADSILGFPLNYNNVGVEGTYLFTNYFNSGSFTEVNAGSTVYDIIPTYTAYLKINGPSPAYVNIWEVEQVYDIPVLQFQSITDIVSSIEITIFDNPGVIEDLEISVFVNNVKKTETADYEIITVEKQKFVVFNTPLNGTVTAAKVLLKCISSATPNSNGTYETPLNLTNNPLNGKILTFTLSEISDHVKSMVDRSPEFIGEFPGTSNLNSLSNISKYGTRLISNQNPLSFAHYFITDPENSVISAIKKTSVDYYQFKNNLINTIIQGNNQLTTAEIVDAALATIILTKNSAFPYALSDMAGYGNNNSSHLYTVSEPRNKSYALSSIYDPNLLSNRAILVYLNDRLLTLDKDYTFDLFDAGITISTPLIRGDTVVIKDYISTVGSYIPPTPTKLGLYPKYEPSIYVDPNFANGPKKVIQGHDGSITIAFTDINEDNNYIDLALLEYETRVFNNIKATYNSELVNVHTATPGLFRKNNYSYSEISNLIRGDFLKWTSVYGLDPIVNDTYSVTNHKTYNFKSATDYMFNELLPGSWRSIYKFYFDTDRPNTHPWEMLGFSIKPIWWDDQYGPAPYTSGNLELWNDLESGTIRQGIRAGIDLNFVRPNLSQIIPVDESGNVVDVREWAGLKLNDSINDTEQDWAFGDIGPVEAAWRRSSLWPFAVQTILALTQPASYASMLFDPSRLSKDITSQYNYGPDEVFLSPSTVSLFSDTDTSGNVVLASGYSVWVIEHGKFRSASYLPTLKQDMQAANFNLFHKMAGFASKDKLEIIIDSVSPSTVNPGVVLPSEDYSLFFNVSNPVKSIPISGIVVEKQNGQFIVKGYDPSAPYFMVYAPVHRLTGGAVTVGGKTESYLTWKASSFYQTGQIVNFGSSFYRVLNGHTSGVTFTPGNFVQLSTLPIIGGTSVLSSITHADTAVMVPYGTRYNSIQEVYDLIVGYGYWLEEQGFIFDEYNQELAQVLDWKFTGKEFLYWTTQNWANGTVITLSPFANTIKYKFTNAVVDNVLSSFYDYSLLSASGTPFPANNFNLSRVDGICTIATKNTTEGLFFAKLNLVQKEHALILVNKSMFNDVVYDIETGYRQSRIRLIGFRTSSWNGEFLSPGFIYDSAQVNDWAAYTNYKAAEVVKYAGKYYSAINSIVGSTLFDATKWNLLGNKPVAQLLPNFDYKINQFEDFYSLDIDNFDAAQQKMAQHLIGYTPRTYLDNIFVNPIAQYKFYQGFIREKGTRNAIDKLAKASIHNLQGQISFTEEWAFRVGSFGNFNSYEEIEAPLKELDFRENSQIVKFVDSYVPSAMDTISYIEPSEMIIPGDYVSSSIFSPIYSTYLDDKSVLPTAGYVRLDDVTATAYNIDSILNIVDNTALTVGDTIWVGFKENNDWDVLRYSLLQTTVTNCVLDQSLLTLTFETSSNHLLSINDIISITGFTNNTDGIYKVLSIIDSTHFVVSTALTIIIPPTTTATLHKFSSVRVHNYADIATLSAQLALTVGELIWVDENTNNKWAVYKKGVYSWAQYRTQVDSVDLSKINRAITIDTISEQIIDYLDIFDPIKGRIPSLADREIRYKTAFDPATYSVGTSSVVVDLEASWSTNQVGQLWWDLSTVKYIWAEQGDLTYRKNSWGKLFPGASIDVYEWVQSEYLPSQWAALTDTIDGAAQGISGIPKYIDDSIVSVTQYYNTITGAATNVYYFWVKNTTVLPNHPDRKLSASDTSSMIYNPANYGIKYVSFIALDAITVTNVKDTLRFNEININISKDNAGVNTNKHSEWLLLEEDSAVSMPTAMLEQKLLDSLLGKDSRGNILPDPLLTSRIRYGISIRPNQSMFKDRVGALRNAIDYVNTILSTTEYVISDFVDFTTLNLSESIPAGMYDSLVENIEGLTAISTANITPAELTCNVVNGKISSINIIDSGTGYLVAPIPVVLGDETGVSITTEINEIGEVISATVINGGSKFISAPTITVRPYTAIVNVDINSNNKWATYQLDSNEWVKIHTQEFDTPLYWDYVDWRAMTFNPLTPLVTTIDEPYLLDTVSLSIGDYVKVKNQGNGRYIILEKVASSGTYSTNYNLIYSEKGTIKFSDVLWNTVDSKYNWDYLNTFDQTLFDQSPEIELSNILLAIKNDIFVGPLKIYWNKFFFKAVKYAMSEQLFLDWAFKTSFIKVRNKAGALDQRTSYKFQNSAYYESYIEEVKPYHTKIRTFEIDYDVIDNTQTYSTDFDLPAMYDTETNQFVPIELDNIALNSYPRKSWTDNYKLSVSAVTIKDGGHGYQTPPIVTIVPAPGDNGTGTVAVAYIAGGKVSSIEILNPGTGYIVPPTITFTGGFSTSTSTDAVLVPITATGYVNIINDTIRSTTIGMKFDRITGVREIGEQRITDSFVCTFHTKDYPLSWPAKHDKLSIDIRLDGITVLADAYNIVDYTAMYNGYHKKYSKVVFVTTPVTGQILSITYNKGYDVYHAVDRIEDYYTPTIGMPGIDPDQLMNGLSFPGTSIQTLPFDYTNNWGAQPFGQEFFGPDTFGVEGIVVEFGGAGYTSPPQIQIVADLSDDVEPAEALAYVSSGTIVSVKIINPGSGYTKAPLINVISTLTAIAPVLHAIVAERSIDTVITGGSFTGGKNAGALGVNPEDVILSGSDFISPDVKSAPEEVIPGEVLESVAISVFTVDTNNTGTIFGFKMFKDIFGREHYKRLAKANATALTATLYSTSTTISVADASVLPTPIAGSVYAGVISVAGERIEYMVKTGNILSSLRRATLGTGARDSYPIGTEVMDQGRDQTIFQGQQVFEVLNTLTVNTQTSYSFTGVINIVTDPKQYGSVTLLTDPADQIDVFYAGRLLNKTDTSYHDPAIAYDSSAVIIAGAVATPADLPVTNILTRAYIVTATNHIWVYQNSLETRAINGYVYNGLNFREKEYTVNTLTNAVVLNLKDGIQSGQHLRVLNKRTSTDGRWQLPGVSLVASTSSEALFLSLGLAALPDKYHYGQA